MTSSPSPIPSPLHCCPTSWDQRIPNEPLLERQFLIQRPPIIPQDIPRNTSHCSVGSERPWLLMTKQAEDEMMNYWSRNVVNKDIIGSPTSSKKHSKTLNQMTKKYPDRPWLHGTHRNIDRDSQLSNRNYYNPKDCIIPCVQHDLCGFNRIADQAMLKKMTEDQLFRNGALCSGNGSNGGFWNQSTSMRMNEPIDSTEAAAYLRSQQRSSLN